MKIVELTALHVRIPLKRAIKHASHVRTETDNLVIRCVLKDGKEGFGESVDLQGENRVHGELDGLAGTVGAEMKKLFAHDVQDGLGFF